MIEEATCPVCNNGLSAHEDGTHPAYVERCFLCKRSDPIKYGTYVRVSWPDGSVKDVCDDCFDKADRVDEYLDYTEDYREGQPEFNGAFR